MPQRREQAGARAQYMLLGGGTPSLAESSPGGALAASIAGLPTVVQDASNWRVAAVLDNNRIVEFISIYDSEYEIPPHALVPLPLYAIIYAKAYEGKVTFIPGAGVVFDPTVSFSTRGNHSVIAMKQVQLDRWTAMGDLESTLDALSVFGNPSAVDGPALAITATADGQSLVRRGGVVGFNKLNQNEVNGLKVDFASSAVWTINHNLGRQVGVSVYTVGGLLMLADVINVSINQAVVNFDTPTAGYAVVL